jgi:hypothetical protein
MTPANAFIKGILKGPLISVLAAALTPLTDSEPKTVRRGKHASRWGYWNEHSFRLWSTGRDVRQALQ